eukprot:1160874-Pelagomonas_calceolata.AAC.15
MSHVSTAYDVIICLLGSVRVALNESTHEKQDCRRNHVWGYGGCRMTNIQRAFLAVWEARSSID